MIQDPIVYASRNDSPNESRQILLPEFIGYEKGCALPKKNKRYVQFPSNSSVSQVVALIKPITAMSKSERKSIWYDSSEIKGFRDDNRSIIKRRRSSLNCQDQKLDIQSHPHMTKSNRISPIRSCDRGLELGLSVERRRKKFLAIRAVLEAQRKLKRRVSIEASCGREINRIDVDNRLALISAKFTQSARNNASEVGLWDFLLAYFSNFPDIPITPASTTRKRTISQMHES